MNIKASLKALGATIYKNRAKIETVAGMGLVVIGTGVVISKAKKATEVAYDLEDMNDRIHQKDADDEWESKKERSKEVRSMIKYAAVEYTKTYAVGLTCVAGGLVLIGISDVTMSKELTAAWGLVSSYAATLANVKDRVIADQGEEKWQEYLLGPQMTEVEVLPDGTVVQKTVPLDNPNRSAGLPPHCILFDESNPNYEKDARHNLDLLENRLRWLNERLDKEEFLWENDICRYIDADLVACGWTAGIPKWTTDPKTGERMRLYLTFGLDAQNPAAQRFRDGIEPSFLIQLGMVDEYGKVHPLCDNINNLIGWPLIQ